MHTYTFLPLSLTGYLQQRIVILLSLLFVISHSLFSQLASPPNQWEKDTIPFTLTDANNLRVPAVLNGTDTLELMFHLASSSVTLIETVTPKLSSLQWDTIDTTKSWGGNHASRRSSFNTLQIGRMYQDSVMIWENKHSGPETDGKFGPDFFGGKVIEIDFDREQLMIHSDLPAEAQQYEKLRVSMNRGSMFVEAKVVVGEAEYVNTFLVHTGYGGAILFDDEFVAKAKLGEQLEIIEEGELKDSYGNVIKTKKAILPTLVIGAERLVDVPVGFFDGAIGRQKMSVMGGEIWKRFNMMIVVDTGEIYVKSSKWKDVAFK